MPTLVGTVIKMDMQWNLIHFGFSTNTGIHEMIQQVPNHDEMNFFVLSEINIPYLCVCMSACLLK